jgi:hypothetical protein
MSTPDVGMSGLLCAADLKARGIGINKRWNAARIYAEVSCPVSGQHPNFTWNYVIV